MRMACNDVKKIPPFHMKSILEMKNVPDEPERGRGQKPEVKDLQLASVNRVQWNPNYKYTTQFMTLDDVGLVSLFDIKKKEVIARHNTGLSLQTGCIEHS